jgi:hypothetical protein
LLVVAVAGATQAAPFAQVQHEPLPIAAKLAAYTVQPDLSNISNRAQLPKLNAAQRQALSSKGFFARPTPEQQLFVIYEHNHYKRLPSFVTVDSVLHAYHIFYDFTLRYFETGVFRGAVEELSQAMFDATSAELKGRHPPAVRAALERNLVYFAVPLVLLGKQPKLEGQPAATLAAELGKIARHGDPAECLTGATLHYSQFVPRGHYTRSETLKRYFMAMMWYGLVPMAIDNKQPGAVRQALVMSRQLARDAKLEALWQRVYEPTSFYVGKADDLSHFQCAPLADVVFGRDGLAAFADDTKVARFVAEAAKRLPTPGIACAPDGMVQGQQYRFLGQRFILDSRMFQELTHPKVGNRAYPLGLDILAVLGNPRAAHLIESLYKEQRYAHYTAQRAKLAAEAKALTPDDWQQNLYYGWLYTLLPLQQPRGAGWPSFMRTTAWQDKCLLTSLASWAELRHDTILYAKQSVSECGGDGVEPPPPPPGWVEPEPEVYSRLAWLLRLTYHGLVGRKLLLPTDMVAHEFQSFIGVLDWLATVSRKELAGSDLSRDDLKAIEEFGGTLERLMLSIAARVEQRSYVSWWDIQSKTDRDMAVIADVHTGPGQVLEEGVGHAAELWVVVPVKGKLVAARGAVFTYYEFKHPMADRLTDERWQQMLEKDKAPGMPVWAGSFMVGPALGSRAPVTQLAPMSTGC